MVQKNRDPRGIGPSISWVQGSRGQGVQGQWFEVSKSPGVASSVAPCKRLSIVNVCRDFVYRVQSLFLIVWERARLSVEEITTRANNTRRLHSM